MVLENMQKFASKMQKQIDAADIHVSSITNSERTSKTHSKPNSNLRSKVQSPNAQSPNETVQEESSSGSTFEGGDEADDDYKIAELHLD